MNRKSNSSILNEITKSTTEYWIEVLFLFVFLKVMLALGLHIF